MSSAPRLQSTGKGILAERPSLGMPEAFFPVTSEVPARRKRSVFEVTVTLSEVLFDFVAVIGAVAIADFGYRAFHLGRQIQYSEHLILEIGAVFSATIVFLLDRDGAYRRASSLLRVKETERVLRVTFRASLLTFAISFFTNFLFSRWLLALSLVSVPLLLIAEKQALYLLIRTLHTRGWGVQRVVIYGAGHTGKRIFSMLARSPKLGLEPVALVDDDPMCGGSSVFEMSYHRRRCAPVLEGPLRRDLIVANEATHVIIAIPSLANEKFQQVVQEAIEARATVAFVPTQFVRSDFLVQYEDLDGQLIASFWENAHTGYEFVKSAWDVAATLVILALGLPLLLLLAILVRLDSPGPALFLQNRVGINGKIFRMFKFRTMRQEVDPYDFSPVATEDPRITRIGKFLRRTSLDELPQLLNVLKGDMALVGPRPEMPFIVDQYNAVHCQRLLVKPGITGLWQLSADRAYLIHENIQYDLYYIRNRSFFIDLAILLHTAVFAMRGV